MTEQLKSGDKLPSVMARTLDGESVDLTANVAGHWAVLLFYRGDW